MLQTITQSISSAIRHLITSAVAGYVAVGYVTADQVNAFADAAIVAVTIVAAVAWSVIEKKYFSKK